MPKLIFLNRYFYPDHSATGQLLADLAFYLQTQGYEVHVIANSRQYRSPDNRFPSHENINGVQIHRVWTSNLSHWRLRGRAIDYLTFYFSSGWQLFKLARKGDVVIALTDPPLLSASVLPIIWLRRAILINWLQDLFPEIAIEVNLISPKNIIARLLKTVRDYSLRHAKHNIVLGKCMSDLLQKKQIPNNKITAIPNWSDGDSIRPQSHNDNQLRDQWNLQDKFVVGYSGNLGRAHEYQTLLQAAIQLQEESNIVFLFIGGGFMFEKLKEEVNQQGLTNVLFKPYQPREQLHNSLSVADIHWVSLLPSLEGLIVPSKFYGIIAAGRPIIMIGHPEGEIGLLVQQHHCGFAISQGDTKTLIEKIITLYKSPKSCSTLGNNARHLFEKQFAQQHSLLLWLKIISHYQEKPTN